MLNGKSKQIRFTASMLQLFGVGYGAHDGRNIFNDATYLAILGQVCVCVCLCFLVLVIFHIVLLVKEDASDDFAAAGSGGNRDGGGD